MNDPGKIAIALLFLAGVGAGSYWIGTFSSSPPLELARIEPVQIRLSMPDPGVFKHQVDRVLEQAGTDLIAATGGARSEVETFPIDSETPAAPDEQELRLRSARYAYVQYGKIGDHGMATLLDRESRETILQGEGSLLDGMKVEKIGPDSLELILGEAPPLLKPRVDLEIDLPTDREPTPEEKEKLLVRYNQLWGSPWQEWQEAPESHEGVSAKPSSPQGPSTFRLPAAELRKEYIRKAQEYRQWAESKDRAADPNDSPFIPTVEEIAEREAGILTTPSQPGDRP